MEQSGWTIVDDTYLENPNEFEAVKLQLSKLNEQKHDNNKKMSSLQVKMILGKEKKDIKDYQTQLKFCLEKYYNRWDILKDKYSNYSTLKLNDKCQLVIKFKLLDGLDPTVITKQYQEFQKIVKNIVLSFSAISKKVKEFFKKFSLSTANHNNEYFILGIKFKDDLANELIILAEEISKQCDNYNEQEYFNILVSFEKGLSDIFVQNIEKKEKKEEEKNQEESKSNNIDKYSFFKLLTELLENSKLEVASLINKNFVNVIKDTYSEISQKEKEMDIDIQHLIIFIQLLCSFSGTLRVNNLKDTGLDSLLKQFDFNLQKIKLPYKMNITQKILNICKNYFQNYVDVSFDVSPGLSINLILVSKGIGFAYDQIIVDE